ncbi:MAG: PilZ domain-containing protein [Pseudomonadota bacterium]
MPRSKSVRTRLLNDLHMGMTDNALMEKYRLSYSELRSHFKDLFDSGLLRPEEGSELMSFPRRNSQSVWRERIGGNEARRPDPARGFQTEVSNDKRKDDRYDLDFDMPVYAVGQPEVQGRVIDITESGARLWGVQAHVGEALTIVALGDTLSDIAPFEFQATCIWTDGRDDEGTGVGGFEITAISDESLEELRKLVRSINLKI